MTLDPTLTLAGLPAGLKKELIECYSEIVRNFIERRWEPSELRGGKFAEVVYSVLDGALSGKFPAKAKKPAKMVDALRALEKLPGDPARIGDRSLRVFIPRALVFLYDIRNQRGVGHVGGDVDPNNMDATAVVATASWVMAELVRIFHGVTTEEAEDAVAAIVERRTPLIWEVDTGEVKRVLAVGMGARDQVLLLLHHSAGWVAAGALQGWVEYKNPTNFRKNVLGGLHRDRLIEFDGKKDRAKLSPLGATDTESRLLNSSG